MIKRNLIGRGLAMLSLSVLFGCASERPYSGVPEARFNPPAPPAPAPKFPTAKTSTTGRQQPTTSMPGSQELPSPMMKTDLNEFRPTPPPAPAPLSHNSSGYRSRASKLPASLDSEPRNMLPPSNQTTIRPATMSVPGEGLGRTTVAPQGTFQMPPQSSIPAPVSPGGTKEMTTPSAPISSIGEPSL